MSAIANAENNHDLDVDNLVVAEAHVGKSFRDQAVPGLVHAAGSAGSRSRSRT
jgi:ribosomal protein L22